MKMKNWKKIRQFMAMFLCVLMVTKLAVPAMATATDSNAQEEEAHIVLQTETESSAQETTEYIETRDKESTSIAATELQSSAAVSDEFSAVESSAQDLSESSAVESSAQDPKESSAVESSAQDPKESSAVESSAQDPSESSAVESSVQDPSESSVVESSAQDSSESSSVESSAQDPSESSAVESSAQESTEYVEEEATPSDATCQECGMTPCECEVCEICGEKNCEEHGKKNVFSLVEMPQIGDKVWIKKGAIVYKEKGDENGYSLSFSCYVEIVDISYDEDGNPEWYEYKYTGLGGIIGNIFLHSYKYVHVENTSIEEPTESEEPKTKQEFDGKEFAAEIPVVVKEADAEDIQRIEEVIPEAEEDCSRESFAYDISGEDQEGVEITISGMIDMEKLNSYGRCYVDVYHLKHNGEIEVLTGTVDWDGNITFETDSFSTFYFMVQYYANDGTYVLRVDKSVKVSTILEQCGVPSGFTITKVEADSGTVKDSAGNDVSWVTIANETNNNAKVTLAGTFTGLHTLTVTVNVSGETKTYTIKVAVPEIFYYLDGTDWCMDTRDESFVLGDVDYGTRTTNDHVLNVTDVTGGVVIYARPGMVLQFTTGWRWGSDEDHLYTAHQDNGGWKWYSGNSQNYVIIDEDISEVKTFTIVFSQNDTAGGRLQHGTTATVHVIPDYTPTLLEDVKGVELRTVPVSLFNYDGNAWKNYYKGQGATELFEFKSASSGVPVTVETLTNSINYGNWTMGILKDQLDANGLPVVTDGYAVDLFSDTAIGTAKEVHSNVDFQFVYDSATGYYTYASQLNAAQFFKDEGKIKLYRENLSAADAGASYQSNNAGFYPFIDVIKAFLNTAGSTGLGAKGTTDVTDPGGRSNYPSNDIVDNLTTWYDKLDDGYDQYSGYLAKDLVSTYDESGQGTVDMHFGLKVQSQFYLPEGKQINEQDIEFSFTGDDDLWVFIDGELVLDLGGGHGPISGTINFTDGTVTAENRFGDTSYYLLTGADGDRTGTMVTEADGSYSKDGYNWAEDEMHTLSIFYLEKCSGHSNCYMRFNIPLVPDSSINVSKKLENKDGESLSVTPDTEYTFTLYTASDDDKVVNAADNAFKANSNAAYTIVGTGAPSGVKYTDGNGQFKLKHGWTAMFADIEQYTEVYIVEGAPNDGYEYVGSKVSVNSTDAKDYQYSEKTEKAVVLKDVVTTFDFVNCIETQPLIVEKQVVRGTEGLIDPDQKFEFTLNFINGTWETGTGIISATDGGIFKLGHGESITIPRVPVNMTFTLKEKNPYSANNSFDAPEFTYVNCTTNATPNAFDTAYEWTAGGSGTNKVTVTNQQRFNLTIKKVVTNGSDENQMFIFLVTGPNDFKMNVTVAGGASTTITKLPVGTYTVEELSDWSWRYDEVTFDPESKQVTPSKDVPNPTVTVTNKRTNDKWLSGDSYAENWWGGGSGDNKTVIRRKEDSSETVTP